MWASTQTTGPCGGVSGSEGLSGAGYTASYAYDGANRITAASVLTGAGQPLVGAAQGRYTYDPTHVHAVASVGSGATGYAASYDAAGEMTCRAVGATTCGSGNEQLTYDALGRLLSWQDAATTPPATEQYAYDGAGQRVWQQATATSGSTTTTTTTTYVLGVEEVTSTSVTGQQPTTNTTSYYALPSGLSASRDGSGLVVQASDLLGTPVAALNLSSGLVGEQLRTPYGQARFSASASTGGGMHTTFGFTGQREDTQAPGSSGLDYFNARYFDPVIGRFTSADPTRPDLGSAWGVAAYAYVNGAVETATDPSGLAPQGGGFGPKDWQYWLQVLQLLWSFVAGGSGEVSTPINTRPTIESSYTARAGGGNFAQTIEQSLENFDLADQDGPGPRADGTPRSPAEQLADSMQNGEDPPTASSGSGGPGNGGGGPPKGRNNGGRKSSSRPYNGTPGRVKSQTPRVQPRIQRQNKFSAANQAYEDGLAIAPAYSPPAVTTGQQGSGSCGPIGCIPGYNMPTCACDIGPAGNVPVPGGDPGGASGVLSGWLRGMLGGMYNTVFPVADPDPIPVPAFFFGGDTGAQPTAWQRWKKESSMALS